MERKHIEYSKLPPPSRHIRHKFTIIKIEFVVFFPSISMNSQFFLFFSRLRANNKETLEEEAERVLTMLGTATEVGRFRVEEEKMRPV